MRSVGEPPFEMNLRLTLWTLFVSQLVLVRSFYDDDLFDDRDGNSFISRRIASLKRDMKEQYMSNYNVDEVLEQVRRRLTSRLAVIRDHGSDYIPMTTISKIKENKGALPPLIADRVRRRGVLVVQDVLEEEQVELELLPDLLQYLYRNSVLPGPLNRSEYSVFWSKTQMRIRQHPNLYVVQKALLKLCTNVSEESDIDLSKPSMFVDKLMMGASGFEASTQPFINGMGGEKWMERSHRDIFKAILEGEVDQFDPFNMQIRAEAIFNSNEDTQTFLRGFHGWVTLSGQHWLRVLPNLKETLAFLLLRAFASDVPDHLLPGFDLRSKRLQVSDHWHPELQSSLVSIPHLRPGDAFFSHPDIVRGANPEHVGVDPPFIVVPVSVGPVCNVNKDYLRRMRHSFLSKVNPPDHSGVEDEDLEKNFWDRATINNISPLGREMMGLELLATSTSTLGQELGRECP